MSKTIQFINVKPRRAHKNAILSGDTIQLGEHKYTLQETDLVRLLMWCEEGIQHAQMRREQRQRMHTGCCDDVRLGKLNTATDPAPDGQDPKRW